MKKDKEDIFFDGLTNKNRMISQGGKEFYAIRSDESDSLGILELYMKDSKKNHTLSHRMTTMELLMNGVVIEDYEVVIKEEYYDLLRDVSMIKSPREYVKEDDKELLICSLTSVIEGMLKNVEEKSEKALNIHGKSFCMTGTLSRVRSEVIRIIEDNGGRVVAKVNGSTDYLLLGDKGIGTTKHTAALRYNTEIISEEDLMNSI